MLSKGIPPFLFFAAARRVAGELCLFFAGAQTGGASPSPTGKKLCFLRLSLVLAIRREMMEA